jgi:hypothetical protein
MASVQESPSPAACQVDAFNLDNGLRGASKAFMKQLGSEIEGFSEKVEYKDVNGKLKVDYARFERLVTDQCMFRYKDAGREMMFAIYVDDIICCTTDLEYA